MKRLLLIFIITYSLISCDALNQFKKNKIDSNNQLKLNEWTLLDEGVKFKTSKGEITLYIKGSDKIVSGMSGCNNYSAEYATVGSRFVISNISTTRMSCDEDANLIENEYLELLEQVDKYIIEGNTLSLYKGKIHLLEFSILQ